MTSTRVLAALFVLLMVAGAAMAQSDAPATVSSEFGSASGGQLELLTKGARAVSGSMGIRSWTDGRSGYEATLGGTLLQDRLWFFGAASMLPGMPQRAGAVDMKIGAQLGQSHSFGAAFSESRALDVPVLDTTTATPLPSSFLSLRYTGVVSNNIIFEGTILRRSTSERLFPGLE